ncbi:MAG: hypothetical protein FJX76_27520 [Armatimonadetes bacterium]|nr:hypothetical protein [Armatimonadota bacterium]
MKAVKGFAARLMMAVLVGALPVASWAAGDKSSVRINSATHTAIGALGPGDVLTVRASGTPVSTATFSVPGVGTGHAMAELSPGNYEGRVILPSALADGNVTVAVTFSNGGQTATRQTDMPLALASTRAAETPAVTLTSPDPGGRVSSQFVVEGTTVPGAAVEVVATERASAPVGAAVTEVRAVQARGVADAQGRFAIPVNMGSLNESASVELSITTTRPNGTVSRDVTTSLTAIGD